MTTLQHLDQHWVTWIMLKISRPVFVFGRVLTWFIAVSDIKQDNYAYMIYFQLLLPPHFSFKLHKIATTKIVEKTYCSSGWRPGWTDVPATCTAWTCCLPLVSPCLSAAPSPAVVWLTAGGGSDAAVVATAENAPDDAVMRRRRRRRSAMNATAAVRYLTMARGRPRPSAEVTTCPNSGGGWEGSRKRGSIFG